MKALPAPAQRRTTVFSENATGTSSLSTANNSLKSGTIEEWTVLNKTNEIHDFHIHQVHFIVEAINGVPVPPPYVWYDSFILPFQTKNASGITTPGSLKLLLDFRDPVIKGTFVYHCHLLDHEDKGHDGHHRCRVADGPVGSPGSGQAKTTVLLP
jgi:FtsP/CotA-like multicopper oxidase with cupredoxin domain